MVKDTFTFLSRDGKSLLYAVRYSPDDTSQLKGVLQIVHGMAEYAERYEELAEYLTGLGYVVTGGDHMGHGRSVRPDRNQGYFCRQDPATVVVRDVHRLKKLTQILFPDIPYYILGHSMGSFILRNYLIRYGYGIDGAIVMGTGMHSKGTILMGLAVANIQGTLMGFNHVSKLLNKIAFGKYNSQIEHPKTTYDWLTRDDDEVSKYIADPDCGFIFTVNGFKTMFELLRRLIQEDKLRNMPSYLPILFLSGTEDPVGDYGRGVEEAYKSMQKAGMTNLEKKMYPGARHEILHGPDRQPVMEDIFRWLERQEGCATTTQE